VETSLILQGTTTAVPIDNDMSFKKKYGNPFNPGSQSNTDRAKRSKPLQGKDAALSPKRDFYTYNSGQGIQKSDQVK